MYATSAEGRKRNTPILRAPFGPSNARVRGWAVAMLAALRLHRFDVSIVLSDDRFIRDLNRHYRKKDRPTDVLAFPLLDGPPDRRRPRALGDIVISLETARHQAHKLGHALTSEVAFLLGHGLLHLVGYDHETDAAEARMTLKNLELVRSAGVRAAPTLTRREALSPSRTQKKA